VTEPHSFAEQMIRGDDDLRRRFYEQRQILDQWKFQNLQLRQRIQTLEEENRSLESDISNFQVLETLLRSGVMKSIKIQEYPELQELLMKFFTTSLQLVLKRSNALIKFPLPAEAQVGNKSPELPS